MRPPFRVKRPDCHNAEVIGRGWGAVFALGAILTVSWADAPRAAAAECAASTSAADLDAFFAADGAGGLAGADYPHAYALPDGRTLWLFQDAFVGADGDLVDDHFAHNAALIQTGSCFSLLPTSGGQGTSWLGSWVEEALGQWFWPLDAEIGADGNLWLFLAEVRNPNRSGAATGAEPVATWRARYRLPDLELLDMEQAADSSSSLYGYSIVSDNDWTYLYGHCYRQFVPGEEYGFDPSCSPHAYLARVPKGQLDRRPYYWTGTGWSASRQDRVPVLTSSTSMPVSVERFGDVYVAASDEGDWYGGDIVIRTAHAPQGPWTEVARYTPDTKCGADCNNYGAFILPGLENDQIVVAHSNNAWDMHRDAFRDASRYRISLRAVAVPGVPGAPIEVDDPPATTVPTTEAAAATTIASVPRQWAEPTYTIGMVEVVDPLHAPPRWNDHLLLGLRIAALALVVAVAGAAALGFMTSARRVAPSRRRRALARLRAGGATRVHRRPSQTFQWSSPASIRGPSAFQADALPTELLDRDGGELALDRDGGELALDREHEPAR